MLEFTISEGSDFALPLRKIFTDCERNCLTTNQKHNTLIQSAAHQNKAEHLSHASQAVTCLYQKRMSSIIMLVSTCSMQVSVNKVIDPWMVIARLRAEVQSLKEELRQDS